MQNTNTLHPFIFDNTAVRGNIVKLNSSFIEALQHQTLPPVIKQALGELMAASALLISTIKIDGTMVLQLQSTGPLKLLVVECQSDLSIRATAKWDVDIEETTLAKQSIKELAADGQFVITIDPKKGDPYQGIVPIKGVKISDMLEHYMQHSQQIDTTLCLHSDASSASGMLLQKLPDEKEKTFEENDLDAWNRINQLANTISNDELKNLPAETLLTRLFHEEEVRLFEGRSIIAACNCSRERVANMLKILGISEVKSVIEEQGSIQINCDFCNKNYVFDEQESATIFEEVSENTTH